jgi:uncharacterized protein YecE (DUF72 family)
MSKASAGTIRIGVGGWTYAPWRGTFYPAELTQKHELEYASRRLSSIEVNGTYYGSQKPETFARWHDETPADFVFSLKAPRFATNRKVLAEAGKSVERFFSSGVMNLKDKLGPVNWQLSPSKKFDPEDLRAFLALLPGEVEGRTLRHVIEVRHASFRCAEFVALAREHRAAVVIAGDSEYSRTGPRPSSTRESWGLARVRSSATRQASSIAGRRGRRPGRPAQPPKGSTTSACRRATAGRGMSTCM